MAARGLVMIKRRYVTEQENFFKMQKGETINILFPAGYFSRSERSGLLCPHIDRSEQTLVHFDRFVDHLQHFRLVGRHSAIHIDVIGIVVAVD